jgi:hypothetical protein
LFGFLEDHGVAGESVDVLSDPVPPRVVDGDRGATHDEDRRCDPALSEACVELIEEGGGLLGGELVSGPCHAVTRSRAGT